jgi:hypothetical protein
MSMRRPVRSEACRLSCLALGLTLVLACGGGGGGGGTSGPIQGTTGTGYGLAPATGPGDVSNVFPTATGDRWFYNTTTSDVGGTIVSIDSLEVTGTRSFNNVLATDFRLTSGDGSGALDYFYLKSPGGITFLGTGDATDWLTTTIGPYQEALFPLAQGTVADFTKTGYSIGVDLDGDGKAESLTAHVTASLAAFSSVTVPAGTFPGAARLVSTISGSVTGSKDGTIVPFSSTQALWAAPGVGIVRQDQAISAGGEATQISAQARGYIVDGVKHGWGVPVTLSKGQLPGNSDSADPGRGAVAAGPGFLALTTWVSATTGSRRLTASLFDGSGAPVVLDATPASATALTSFGQAAAFDGTSYLAVCSQNDNSGTYPPMLGIRISPTGTILDPAGLVLAPQGGFIPAAAAGGGGTLVVYSRYDNISHHYILYGVRVGTDGTVGPESTIMAVPDTSMYGCAVAFDGTNFLVVSSGEHLGLTTTHSLYGARVTPAGAVLDPTPLLLVDAPCAPGWPALAFDGTHYLLAWNDARTVAPGIYGARISVAGALLDGTPTASGFPIDGGGTLERGDPALGFNGTDYLVCWSLGAYAGTGAPCITGAKVAPTGSLDGTAFPVSGAPPAAARLYYPVVATSSQGTACIWLVNSELQGTVKEMDGVVAW